MKRQLLLAIVACFAAAVAAGPAAAQMVALIDYVGYGWEDGGVPPSDPGDVLQIAAIADALDPVFGVDLGTDEVTIYISGLTSTGGFVDGFTGWTIIGYVGGTIEVYSDPAKDHDWGVFPPNGTTPSTFTNGTLLFQGAFTDFTLILTAAGAGSYDGNIDGIGGTVAELCTDCAYTFGGAFTSDTGAQIPDGYHLQIDGTLEVDSAVKTTQTGWGALKALYQN
jgi:hypothetical protein